MISLISNLGKNKAQANNQERFTLLTAYVVIIQNPSFQYGLQVQSIKHSFLYESRFANQRRILLQCLQYFLLLSQSATLLSLCMEKYSKTIIFTVQQYYCYFCSYTHVDKKSSHNPAVLSQQQEKRYKRSREEILRFLAFEDYSIWKGPSLTIQGPSHNKA